MRRFSTIATLLVPGTMLLMAASRPATVASASLLPIMSSESLATYVGAMCASSCTECSVMGAVGARRESGPLLNDINPPNFTCDSQASCAYCFGDEHALLTDQLEAAIKNNAVAEMQLLLQLAGDRISVDVARGALHVTTCGGLVAATFPVTMTQIAALNLGWNSAWHEVAEQD